MNKLLLTTALLFPLITLAADEETVSQSAINPHGMCEEFSTEETIPNTWKIVDSCENYETEKVGTRPEDVLKRRWTSRINARTSSENTEKKAVLRRSRIGSGTLTRGGADRESSTGISKQPRRTTTTPQYKTNKQFLLDDSRRLVKTRSEWLRRRNARTGIKSGSATEMERTGELSNKFWSTEQATRNERLESQESTEGWENYLYNRQYISKQGRREKKVYTYKGPTLRRMYRGSRLEGNLE